MAPAGEGSSKSPQPALFPTAQKTGQKRRQVKNACTKCQKSSKGCDSGRPCRRCVRYGFGVEECVDSPRKERQKGAKRGPYKKRNAIAIPLPAGVDQSAGVEPMSYAYSTFYAGPGPGPVPQGEACYPGWLPTVMEPPSNPSFSTSQPMFPHHGAHTDPRNCSL
ncbi:hypothetical protein C8F01DRAFT_21513 [Mycena amicta]|nr:hypothetical protein C8F01DRAFT_21513 [Mycena amicta]